MIQINVYGKIQSYFVPINYKQLGLNDKYTEKKNMDGKNIL